MNPYAAGYGPVPNQKDESDLNLLSVLHYVWSAFLGCGTVGVGGYFVLLGGIFGASATSSGADPTGAAVAGGAMVVIGAIMAVVMAAFVVLHVLAASGLKKRKRRVLIYVASALMCTSFPLGTALGVFTIIVLGRPSVKALFQ